MTWLGWITESRWDEFTRIQVGASLAAFTLVAYLKTRRWDLLNKTFLLVTSLTAVNYLIGLVDNSPNYIRWATREVVFISTLIAVYQLFSRADIAITPTEERLLNEIVDLRIRIEQLEAERNSNGHQELEDLRGRPLRHVE